MRYVYHIYPCLRQENFSSPFTKRGIQVLGLHKQKIFSKDPITELYLYAQGNPRVINILADNALLLGYARATRPITPDTIRKCYEDMSLQRCLPEDSEETVEAHELKIRKDARGRFWKWAISLCPIGALVAFAGTRIGGESLWKVFGLKAPDWQIPADTVRMGQVQSQQGASSGTAGSVPLEETHEPPRMHKRRGKKPSPLKSSERVCPGLAWRC
jgi:hypothetical protein